MSRKGWVYCDDGRVIEKGTPEHHEYLAKRNSGIFFVPDDESFVSPIDKKVYSGRAGMREHNAKHNVVNNRDLKGLPTLTTHRPPPPDTEARRQAIIETMHRKGYMS